MEYLSHSEQETETLGAALAQRLHGGDVIAYRGDLGAGKTAFTRGLARGLGCTGRVTSPTFTIVNEYEGKIPLFHFDLYRLGDEAVGHRLGRLFRPGRRVRRGVERELSRGHPAGGGYRYHPPLPGK